MSHCRTVHLHHIHGHTTYIPLSNSGLCPYCGEPPSGLKNVINREPRATRRIKSRTPRPGNNRKGHRGKHGNPFQKAQSHTGRHGTILKTAWNFAFKPRTGCTNSQPNLQTPNQLQVYRTIGQWQGAMGTD